MSTNLVKFFTLSLLLSGSCFARGGAVRIELLIDNNEFIKFRENIKKIPVSLRGKEVHVQDVLENEAKGFAPHMSFLDVKDESGVIKENYAQFIETVCKSLIPCNFYYNDQVGVYSKKENSISEAKNFWCLKEQNSKNQFLSKMATDTKQKIEDFIQDKVQGQDSKQDDFKILSHEQARMSLRKTTKENRDWVSLNKTFPHVTISKKENDFTSNDFVDVGKLLQLKPSFLPVSGVKFTYNFDDGETPDLNIQKDFDASNYVSGFNQDYNINGLLFEINKINHYKNKGIVSNIKSEGDLYIMKLLEYTNFLETSAKESGELSSSESDNDDIGRDEKEYYKNSSITISNKKVPEMELDNRKKKLPELSSSESDSDDIGRDEKEYYKNSSITISNKKVPEMELDNRKKKLRELSSSESDSDDIGRDEKEYYKNNSIKISNKKVPEMELDNSKKKLPEFSRSSESGNNYKKLSARDFVNNSNNNSRERDRNRFQRDDFYRSAYNNNRNRVKDRDFFADIDREIERDRVEDIEKAIARKRRQERFKDDALRGNNNNNNNNRGFQLNINDRVNNLFNDRPQQDNADSQKNKRKYEGNDFLNTKHIRDDFIF